MQRPDASPRAPALTSVAARIGELPHPERTRILLELAGDMEALSAELRGLGVPDLEAEARAAERVVPSEPALDALVRLHRPLYRRLTAPVPDSSLRRWERGSLLATTLVALGGGVFFLGREGLLVAPSPFLWVVLALAGAVVAVALAKGFQLFIRREHRPESLQGGLGLLLTLSGTAVAVAAGGVVAGLWKLASTMEAGASEPLPLVTAWVFRESVLATTGLLTALAGGLAWFLLAQGTAAVRGGDQQVRQTLETEFPAAGEGSSGAPLR